MHSIAIVGMGCRFPGGVDNLEKFWDILKNGKDATTDVPGDRWNIEAFYDTDKAKPFKTYTKHGGFLDNIDKFDPAFFGISPREAEFMDPQQRILLEVAWESMEDAGIDPKSIAGKDIGVFVGAFVLDYKIIQFKEQNVNKIGAHTATGSMMTMLSNRISYIFDFKGPSMSIDTACSSSLVAVHTACRSILNGECSMALAGGINLLITPEYTISECKGGFLSPDGRCKTWDESADGYARGEGAGIIILKPLLKAFEDRDMIYGVIRSSGINQDGKTNGITVPNGKSQERLMRSVYKKGNVPPDKISYIEAHGTGTPVGDPIEANAISNVVSEGRKEGEKCAIGSVKTNIGHLEAAAGIAGLIKSALILKYKQIVPNIHFIKPNPKINFEKLSIRVATKVEPLDSGKEKAYIGVNSFGFGGTNSHILLEEAPENAKNNTSSDNIKRPFMFTFSAKNNNSLNGYINKISNFLKDKDIDLKDIAHTLVKRKSHHNERLVIIAKTKEELLEKLNLYIEEKFIPGMVRGNVKSNGCNQPAFVYTGMGPIWWGMGRQLFESDADFRKVIEQCDQLVQLYGNWSLIDEFTKPKQESMLDQPMYSQPANFALQAALTKVFEKSGIVPRAVIGHSVGEVAAAFAAGIYSLKDAMFISFHRSMFNQKLVNLGKMLAVSMSSADVKNEIEKYGETVSIAAVNSPTSVTLSGDSNALEEIQKTLTDKNIFARVMNVNVPYHSYHVDKYREEFLDVMKHITPKQPCIDIFSTAFGKKIDWKEYTAEYWWQNTRGTVQFERTMYKMAEEGHDTFVEIGPHPVLSMYIKECLAKIFTDVNSIASLKRKNNEQLRIFETLAELYVNGYDLDFDKIQPSDGNFVRLPSYVWDRKRYWNESIEGAKLRIGVQKHKILGMPLKDVIPKWQTNISLDHLPYLRGHVVQGAKLFPGAGYIGMGIESAKEVFGSGIYAVEDIEFKKAMFIKNGSTLDVQTSLNPSDAVFTISSKHTSSDDESEWETNAVGRIAKSQVNRNIVDINGNFEEISKRCIKEASKQRCYEVFDSMGFNYGESFQGIDLLWKGDREALAKIVCPSEINLDESNFSIHPVILDTCFQVSISNFAGIHEGDYHENRSFLPTIIDKIQVYKKPSGQMWCYSKLTSLHEKGLSADIVLFDSNGEIIAEILNFSSTFLEKVANTSVAELDKWIYKVNWMEDKQWNTEENEIEQQKDGKILIFADTGSLGEQLAQRFEQFGKGCIIVAPNKENIGGIDSSEIFDGNLESVQNLFNEILKDSQIDKVVHMNSLDALNETLLDTTTLEKINRAGCIMLKNIVQTAAKKGIHPKLWIVTRGLYMMNEKTPEQCAAQASVAGFGRVVGHQELSRLWGGLVDLDLEEDQNDAEYLFNEITVKNEEDQIAYRDGKRYIQRIDKKEMESFSPAPTKYYSDKSYLVTGAFGALGMVTAKHIVKKGVKNIILAGRCELPERRKWKKIDKKSSLFGRIEFIKQLEKMGATVHIAVMDITDFESVKNFANDYEDDEWPEIAGIIHSAGTVNGIVVEDMDDKSFYHVLNPKVLGTWNLHKVFEKSKLDFFVMYSSQGSLVVSPGQTNYAAGNAFIDALSHYRSSKGMPSLSINWGPWKEVGMAAQFNLNDFYRERGIDSIMPAQGMVILERLMSLGDCQSAVIPAISWKTLCERHYLSGIIAPCVKHLVENEKDQQGSETNNSNNNILKQLAKADEETQKQLMIENLTNLVAGIMRFEPEKMNPKQSLSSLGIDSMIAIEIRNKVGTVFETDISFAELLQGFSVENLADKLLTDLKDVLTNTEESQSDTKINSDLHKHIKVIQPQRYYELSPAQQRLYILNSFEDGDPTNYNMPFVEVIEGKIDIEKIKHSLTEIVKRHESLRSSFVIENEKPVMEVHENVDFEVDFIDTLNKSKQETDEIILSLIKPFDLSKAPLVRCSIIRMEHEKHLLFIDTHHIISDLTSMHVFAKEFINGYLGKEIPPLNIQYKDFSAWQNEVFKSDWMKSKEKYWVEQFKDEIPLLEIPTDYTRPPLQNYEGAKEYFELDSSFYNKLKDFCKETNCTLFMVMLSAYYVTLSKYSKQEDIVVGSPIEGRIHRDIESLMGIFINTLPLRNFPISGKKFREFLKEVKLNCLNAYENQEYQFDQLINKLDIVRDTSRNPLFDTMFSIQNKNHFVYESNELKSYPHEFEDKISQFDLSLEVSEFSNKLAFELKYCTKLFKPETMARLGNHYINILNQVINNPETLLSEIETVTEYEKNRILYDFNEKPDFDFEKEKTVYELFEQQILTCGESTALVFEGKKVTFNEVNEKSNKIARYLLDSGLQKEQIVAVMLERSPLMIQSIMGIWKSGGCYMPIDPSYPIDRISILLNESKASKLLTVSTLVSNELRDQYKDNIIEIDKLDKQLEKLSSQNLNIKINLSNLAYVLFTSGSTGNPKGVMIEHAGMVNHINNTMVKGLSIDQNSIIAQNASQCFDTSVWQMFTGLVSGAKTVIYPKKTVVNIEEFVQHIIKDRVSILEIVPSFMGAMFELLNTRSINMPHIEYLITSGEAVKPKLVNKWLERYQHTCIINIYGPAEASDGVTLYFIHKKSDCDIYFGNLVPKTDIAPNANNIKNNHDVYFGNLVPKTESSNIKNFTKNNCDVHFGNLVPKTEVIIKTEENNYSSHFGNLVPKTESSNIKNFAKDNCDVHFGNLVPKIDIIPIGKPIKNVNIYILDNNMKLCPIGVNGEICISGLSVGRGYINNDEMTKKSFTTDPFSFDPSTRLYKTGDVGRWLEDGNIEYVGRIDFQVKIRGFRIEIGEIESVLLNHEHIKETVVVAKNDSAGVKYLCAYLVCEEADISDIRKYLLKKLPGYMVPSYFIQLEKLPLTPNGKIDRNALPEPEGGFDTRIEYVAPRNDIEMILAKTWKEVLTVEKVGIYDNFFEIGGHSLKATILVSKIHKELSVEIPLIELFKTPTIDGIAKYILESGFSVFSKIEKLEKREYYALSSAQKRLFILDMMEEGKSINYNMPAMLKIRGMLDIEKLKNAFDFLINRHELFRTSFDIADGEPVQKIDDSIRFEIKYDSLNGADVEKTIKEYIKPFNLRKAPLLRLNLLKIDEKENEHVLFVDMHHIISDGISAEALIKEFVGIYNGKTLPELTIQYKDFAAWQNNMMNSEPYKKQETYWLKEFEGGIPVLDMPLDYTRPVVQSFEGETIEFNIENETVKELNKLARESTASLYMVLLAAYNTLLSRYTGQDDIVVGSPIAGRRHADLQNTIGMFVNTLAMRNYPQCDKSFSEFLKEVKNNALTVYDNQDVQFEELVEKLKIKRDLGRNPLFDTMFVLQNIESTEIEIEGLKFSMYDIESNISKFDITLTATEVNNSILFNLQYCTKLFTRETMKRFADYFVNILNEVVKNPDLKLSEIEILTQEEKHKLLYDFNDTKADYPADSAIHQLFEEQVEKTPDNIALVFEEEQLTYRELNNRANALARMLIEKGVHGDTIVGIAMEHSFELIVSIFGVLKTGGAYLPIETDYPQDRIAYILKDSGVNILLTGKTNYKKVNFTGESVIVEELCDGESECTNIQQTINPLNPAYVIYTSGSTGNPKGVTVYHKGLTNYIVWASNVYKSEEKLDFPLYSSIAFDLTVTSIFVPLISGSKIIIYSEDKQELLINKIFQENKVSTVVSTVNTVVSTVSTAVSTAVSTVNTAVNTVSTVNTVNTVKLTPAHLHLVSNLDNSNSSIKTLIVGGEELKTELARKVHKSFNGKVNIFNEYGPTETVVGCMIYKFSNSIDNNLSVPIGIPADNVQIYLLDQYLKPVPKGVTGEIYISGEGVAKGYLNSVELTTEKFVQNPFISGKTMYRTGDIARFLSDGNIEFLGRIDSQVKVRGYRIELGEIENCLLKHESLKEAVVVAKDDPLGVKYLCAYLVYEEEPDVLSIREHLSKELPEYMIPSYFVQLEELPLTPNGKVDKKALPEPDGRIDTGIEYVAPTNDIEKKLAEIWQKVLTIERVGTNDNFFEIGGHSLKAATLVSQIHKEFDLDIPLKEVFRCPVLRDLAKVIDSTDTKNTYHGIQKAEVREYYAVSKAQKRIYLLNQITGNQTIYNMLGVMNIEGNIDKTAFGNAYEELINRHEALRTSFHFVDENPVQIIHENIDAEIAVVKAGKDDNIDQLIEKHISPFDLEKTPLSSITLIENSEDRHVMVFNMHHIISDGMSEDIFIREFIALYNGEKLAAPKIQYKDFSEWQNSVMDRAFIESHEKYWTDTFNGEIPVLNLPTDYTRPDVQSFEGTVLNFETDEEIANKLNKIATESGSTMYMVLLSAYNVLLSKYSGQDDIVIGTPIAGRSHADLQNTMGVFVNTLAMRNYPEDGKLFCEFLAEVKENSLNAYENKDYQFEDLVEKLNVAKDLSKNPLFDTMFVLQNTENQKINIENLKFSPYGYKEKTSKFDITLYAKENNGKIEFTFEYCTKLFNPETISKMSEHFLNILKNLETDIRLNSIKMISEYEKDMILNKFNNTDADYPKNTTMHQLFENQVSKTPDNMAVIFNEQNLTYSQLNKRANKLALTLRYEGIKPNDIIGAVFERSIEMIVGIYAILKSGGAYLPIDPSYPPDRISYMLENSNAKMVLTQERFLNKVNSICETINVEDELNYLGNGKNLKTVNKPTDAVYVIYTSGSTGNPKGVLLNHYSLVNRLNWMQKNYSIGGHDVILQKTPFTFDVSAWEIFWWSFTGSAVCMLEPKGEKNPASIIAAIEKYKVTTMHFVPSMLSVFLSDYAYSNEDVKKLASLKQVFASGEALTGSTVNKFNENLYITNKTKLINLYGPTEAAIDVSYFNCASNEKLNTIPIGKPIDNIKLYIVGKHLELLPVGIPGELCISGDGLARCYINNQKLTDEKFVPNPFEHGKKMYRTGDIAKWLNDGNIEFLGRLDNQVKVRGNRVELGEIESCIAEIENVEQSIVLKNGEDKNAYLCAYIVMSKEMNVYAIKQHISSKLPEYMVPSYFIQLEQMPLTQSGKIDRKALPEIDEGRLRQKNYIAPVGDVQEKLEELWLEILELEQISVNENFFELGGHSLKGAILASKIYKHFDVKISLREIFEVNTIEMLSEYIKNATTNKYLEIEKVEEREYYPVSSAQKRMYILNQLEKNSTNYNMPEVLIIEGTFDKAKFENAVNLLVERHEIFRTSFEMVDDQSIQKVHSYRKIEINYQNGTESDIEGCLKEFIRPFDLSKQPLIRITIISISENKRILLLDMHHIIFDGTSANILRNELAKILQNEELPNLRIQYKDFAVWQNKLFETEKIKLQEEYWLDAFSGELPVLNMPSDYKRPALQSFEGSYVSFTASESLTAKLEELAIKTNSTLYMVLLSAYNTLLFKYTGQNDIIIGSPIAGRNYADLENILGMFANTLALKNHPESDKTFLEFLSDVKNNTLKAYENQDYPFEQLVEKLNVRRDMSRNPLFDTMFVLQNMVKAEMSINGAIITPYQFENRTAKFDLLLCATEFEDNIKFELEYCSKLYEKKTVERFTQDFINILERLVKDPDLSLQELVMLTDEEKNNLIFGFNQTRRDYGQVATIHEMFELQVEKTPEHTAIVYGENSITYRELNSRSNAMAIKLRENGVGRDSIIAIMAERSIDFTVSVLAVLKSGGAYLPIDSSYPIQRISYMLENSNAVKLLTSKELEQTVKILDFKNEVMYLEQFETNADVENLQNINTGNDLIYVIYTSGTTGTPKGVMLEHKNMVNLINFENNDTNIDFSTNVMQFTTSCFDVCYQEIFSTLLSGGQLHIISETKKKNVEEMFKFVKNNRIEIIFLPTSYLKFIGNDADYIENFPKTVKHIITAGEQLIISNGLETLIKQNEIHIHNHYGPSETHVVTALTISPYETVPMIPSIGRPIGNTEIYILDECGDPQSIGVAGELYISGANVGRGYINNSGQTAARFVDNCFILGKTMYKTGDVARWLTNGTIEFLGRKDSQIKIRGFRIELSEIESHILNFESISKAVVMCKQDNTENKYICAYVVSDESIAVSDLRVHLSESLPEYMIPSYFMQIDKIPLMPNGKVDAKQLPEIQLGLDKCLDCMKPSNDVEEKLVEMLCVLLGSDKISINHNFFEMGGNSLKAISLVSKIHKEFNVSIELRDIFRLGTIKNIAELIMSSSKKYYASIPIADKKDFYPATSAQKRLYALNHLQKKSLNYNIAEALIIHGQPDIDRIEDVLNQLVQRHESLRTSFDFVDGQLVQFVHENVDFKLDRINCKKSEKVEDILLNYMHEHNLGKAPLLKVGLAKLDEQKYALLFDFHHIITDGVSLSILINELIKLYSNEILPALSIQYKDFAQWKHDAKNTLINKIQEKYWHGVFKQSSIPVLKLPVDYARPDVQNFEGSNVSFEIDEKLSLKLKDITKQTDTTMFMLLLTAYDVLLSKYSAQEDIIIGVPTAGRNHTEIENTVGVFINTLAIRNFPDKNKTFEAFLEEVKETSLKAFSNQDYQFEQLVESLNIRSSNRNPLFDAMFVMQDIDFNKMKTDSLQFETCEYRSNSAKVDIQLTVIEKDGYISLDFEYCTRLFKEETIIEFSKSYIEILEIVSNNTDILLKNIDIATIEAGLDEQFDFTEFDIIL